MPKVIVFDLDDTLYLERDFAVSGFRAADAWLASEHGVTGLATHCLSLFESGRRTRVFDEAVARLGAPADGLAARLIDIYRTHPPLIRLAPDAERCLAGLPAEVSVAIITDGMLATQQGKIRALGLDRRVGLSLCTDQWGRDFWKPHPRAFEAVEAWSGASGPALAYVADNPSKDFVTPRRRGWLTVQIARPDRVHRVEPPDADHAPHAVIETLDDLDRTLLRLADLTASPAQDATA